MRTLLIGLLAAFLLVTGAVADERAPTASPFPDLEGTHFYAVTQCGVLVNVFWIDEGEDRIRLVRAIHSAEVAAEVMAARERARADGQVWIVRLPPNGRHCLDT